jgi:hypothetical protein
VFITDLLDQVLLVLLFLHVNVRLFINLCCVQNSFCGFLRRICLKQYNFDFSSSVDDVACFQMMYIMGLIFTIVLQGDVLILGPCAQSDWRFPLLNVHKVS